MKNITVGDTVLIYWLATERWESANYRGRIGDKAVIVKDQSQMAVPFDDLRWEPVPEAAQCEDCGKEWVGDYPDGCPDCGGEVLALDYVLARDLDGNLIGN